MRTRIKSRVLSFIMAVLLIVACSTESAVYKVFAASQGPEILITEIMPMSQSGEDTYEYIEVYNNSDENIDLKDYKFPLQNVDFAASKVIAPKGVILICTSGTTTLAAFNTFYGTSLTEGQYAVLPSTGGILSNATAGSVTLAKDDAVVVVKAEYNSDDFEAKKSITYRYEVSGFDMYKLGTKQVPTPGSVDSSQIPNSGIRVTGIALDKVTLAMDTNQTARVYATVSPATATDKSVIWMSDDPDTVSVDTNGVLTSKKEGDALITVKTVDGGYTAFCEVFVEKVHVTGVTLDKTNITLHTGQAVILSASINPIDATNKQVTWSSSDSSIASVDSNGIITGKSRGTAVVKVKATDGNYSASCNVNVYDTTDINVTGVLLDKTNVTLETGRAIILVAQVMPDTAVNKKVTWSSSNPDTASVDKYGIVYARREGTSLITVRTEDGGYTATCTVTVTDEEDDNGTVTGFRLNKASLSVKVGNSHRIVPVITPDNTKNVSIKWESENPDIAWVSQGGWIVGLSEGRTVINAKTDNGKSDSCIVYVRKHDNGKSKWKDDEKDKGDDKEKSKSHGRWK